MTTPELDDRITMHLMTWKGELTLRPTKFPIRSTTPFPDLNNNNATTTQSNNLDWLPYAIAGTAAAAFLILLLFCCCKSLRDMCICCCFVRTRHNTLVTPSMAPPDSRYTSGYGPSAVSGLIDTAGRGSASSKFPSSHANRSASQSRRSDTSVQTIHTYGPSIKVSSMHPSKSLLISGAKTQKYIGTILTTGRRSKAPLSKIRSVPSKAPSAAQRVVKTQKIIGNILTQDGSNKRKTSG